MCNNDEMMQIWNTNADFWDEQIGDGNLFQEELIEPATRRLLGDITGKKVLDVACGAGRFARQMAEMGADVLAVDFCERFLERARKRTAEDMKNIEYRQVDVTDSSQLLKLGAQQFDIAVCTMGLMDISDIEPLFDSLPYLIKPGGRFVFSIMHPCFQPPESTAFAEETEYDSRTELKSGVKITKYIKPESWKGIGVPGQPVRHFYFHRPLSMIFNIAFEIGFAVDGFEEPVLPETDKKVGVTSWRAKREIPPIVVVRLKKG